MESSLECYQLNSRPFKNFLIEGGSVTVSLALCCCVVDLFRFGFVIVKRGVVVFVVQSGVVHPLK